jgi:hypothetical protein
MQARTFLAAAFGALALSLASVSAQTAPAGGIVAALEADAADAGQVEKVTYGYGWRRHCHWHYGYRHCDRGYGYRHWRHYGHYGDYGYYRHHYGWDYPYYRRHRHWY